MKTQTRKPLTTGTPTQRRTYGQTAQQVASGRPSGTTGARGAMRTQANPPPRAEPPPEVLYIGNRTTNTRIGMQAQAAKYYAMNVLGIGTEIHPGTFESRYPAGIVLGTPMVGRGQQIKGNNNV